MTKPVLYVLDFDKTLILNDSISTFVWRYFSLKDLFKFYCHATFKVFGLISPHQFKLRVMQLVCAEKYNDELYGLEFFEIVKNQRSFIFNLVIDSPVNCIIVSATPKHILDFLLQDVVSDTVKILGTGNQFFYGPQKLKAVEYFLGASDSKFDLVVGFGDSKSDLCLAEICDVFFLVSRDNLISCNANH